MFTEFFKERKRYFFRKPKDLDKGLKADFSKIKKEVEDQFEDHLQSINENTNEIQSNYEFMCELDAKIDKFAERIDKIQLFLQSNSNFIAEGEKTFDIRPLTKTEQEIFMVIYALEDEKGIVSYRDIALKTGLAESLVSNYIASIIEKGVPILKKYVNSRPFLKLDSEFKTLQAKENLLMIDTAQKELANF